MTQISVLITKIKWNFVLFQIWFGCYRWPLIDRLIVLKEKRKKLYFDDETNVRLSNAEKVDLHGKDNQPLDTCRVSVTMRTNRLTIGPIPIQRQLQQLKRLDTLKRIIRQKGRIRGRVQVLGQGQAETGVSVAVGRAGLADAAIARIPHKALLTLFAVLAVGVVLALRADRQFVLAGTLAVAVALAGHGAIQPDVAEGAFARFRLDTVAVPAALAAHRVTTGRLTGRGGGNGHVAGFAGAIVTLQKNTMR